MPRRQLDVTFEVRRGRLARHVRLKDGRGYTQHCTLATLILVAHLVEEFGPAGVTTHELWDSLPDTPCTQVSVALAFLKDRGCMETEGRRNYPASGTVYEDALTEFYYLANVAEQPTPGDET